MLSLPLAITMAHYPERPIRGWLDLNWVPARRVGLSRRHTLQLWIECVLTPVVMKSGPQRSKK